MKELKRGTLVWHKTHGRGIVCIPDNRPLIHFEGKTEDWCVNRNSLFTKGDKVEPKYSTGWSGAHGYFYSPLDHNPEGQKKYTIKWKEKRCNKVVYVYDVRHTKESAFFPKEKQWLLSAVEKTIINHPITVDNIIETTVRAGQLADVGIKAEKVLKEKLYHDLYQSEFDFSPKDQSKEALLTRIKILELQAKVKELEN